MEYKIAIPSYKRADTLINKTLAYLKRTNVNMAKVFVFVANHQEEQDYAAAGIKNIVVGKETIKAQRNFIRRYFSPGEFIFSIDDDVDGIFTAESVKKVVEVQDLDTLIRQGFQFCSSLQTKLFGVGAVVNPLFIYNKKVSVDLRYIVGAAFGQIIDHDPYFDQTIDDKGDYQRSIKYYKKYKRIVRLNSYAVKTKYYKESGGMQDTRTKERVKMSAIYLLNEYPEYCKINTAKKNKEFFEIKLKDGTKGNNITR